MNFRTAFAWMVIPGSIALCLSCNETKGGDSTDSLRTDMTKIFAGVITKANYHHVQNGDLAVFYVMNKFNAGSPDTAMLYRWLDPFLDSVSERGYDTNNDLFTNDGGGVMGSQFNPNADVLIMGFFDQLPDSSSLAFTVNDFPIESKEAGIEKMKGADMYMCWTILSQATWNYMRHPASDSEIDSICAKRSMKKEEWVKNGATVLRLAVSFVSKGVKHRSENYLMMSFAQ